MIRIGFVGVPGAGKTSTARVLSGSCRGIKNYQNIELISEYARRYQAQYGTILDVKDQIRVLEKQVNWEDTIGSKVQIIMTDSPVHLGWLYTMDLRDPDNDNHTVWVNDIFKKLNKLNCPRRYDIIFHLPPVITPVDDGIRPKKHFDKEWREQANMDIINIFKMFPPKHFLSLKSTDMQNRISECMTHMKHILK